MFHNRARRQSPFIFHILNRHLLSFSIVGCCGLYRKMATNGEIGPEITEMAEHDDEKVVTMMDVLKEQEDFEEDANAVLGASDDKNCTYPMGYIKRQAIYACMTCCADAKYDSTKRAGVCLACSLKCHEDHELIELYTKRNFRCDCGNPKFTSNPCQFTPNKTELNDDNDYNQNFSGLYCVCHRPYPDPEITEEDEMIQCIICEDWLHSAHLDATVPDNDQYAEMICKNCMQRNEFLHNYSDLAVNTENDFVNVVEVTNDVPQNNIDVEMAQSLDKNKTEYEHKVEKCEQVKENTLQKGMNEEENEKDTNISMDAESVTTENISDLDKSKDKIETSTENNVSVDQVLLEKKCDMNMAKNEVSSKVTEDDSDIKEKNNAVTASNTSLEAKICDNEEGTILNEALENSSKDIGNKQEEPNKNIESPKHIDNTNVPTNIISEEFVKCEEQEKTTQLLNGDKNMEISNKDKAYESISEQISTNDEPSATNTSELLNEDLNKTNESINEHITTDDPSEKTSTKPLNEEDNMEILNENETVRSLNEQIAENDKACPDMGTKSINEENEHKQLLENNKTFETTDQNEPTESSTESKTTESSNDESQTEINKININEKSMVVNSSEELEKMEEDKLLEDPDDINKKATNENEEKTSQVCSKPEETGNDKPFTVEGDDVPKPSETYDESTVKHDDVKKVPNFTCSNTEAIKINHEEIPTSAVINNSICNEKININSDIEHSTEDPISESEKPDIKRKLSVEESQSDIDAKKLKLDSKPCVKPKHTKQKYKGATFWPAHFRQKLCTCNECLAMYKDLSVLFLIDPEDTVSAYEHLGKEKTNGKPASEYEKGLAALSSLDRIQQINALTEYNKMRDKLLDFLKSFKDRKEVVKEEDIKAFFAGMKPKREPDGVYFCR